MIFAAIAIAWLAYLVPHFVRSREGELVEDDVELDLGRRFSDSMRIVRYGTAPLLDQDLSEIKTYEVSTPQTRRAAVEELRRLEQLAAVRRRRVLLGLMAVLSATIGVSAVGWLPWWAVAIPGGLLVGFAVLARVSVQVMRRSLDARYVQIHRGSSEKTVVLSRKSVAAPTTSAAAPGAVTEPAKAPGGLWDPIPITVPTYVSKPLAPRTVRTIDLSGPGVTSSARHTGPVTADAPHAEPAPTAAQSDDGEARAASA